MPNITKKEAIRECKELWAEIEESELDKFGFLNSQAGERWRDKGYVHDCPLCELAFAFRLDCPKCPLVKQYGKNCYKLGFRDRDEFNDINPRFFKAVRELKEAN